MTEKMSKHWIVLAALSFLAMSSLGLVINVGGVFLTPISQDLDILRGSISMHATLTQISSAVVGIFVPKLIKTFHLKKIILTGILLAAGSTIMLGLSNQVWQFNLFGTTRGIGAGLIALVPLTMIINQWFHSKQGIATSIVMTAPGLIGVLFSPIFSGLIEQFDWRISYISLGILMIMFSLFPLVYPFKFTPEQEGIKPYGHMEKIEEEKENKKEGESVSKRDSARIVTGPLIFYMFMAFFISGVTSFIQHLPGMAESFGFSAVIGGTMLSAAMVGNIVFKLLIGLLIDRTSALKASLIILGVSAVSAVGLSFISTELLLIALSFGIGSIYSVSTVGITTMTTYFFGADNFGRVYPTVSFFKSFGVALFISIYGYIYDFTGTFIPNIWLILLMIAFGVLVMIYNEKRIHHGNHSLDSYNELD